MTLFSDTVAKIMSPLLIFSTGCFLINFAAAAELQNKTNETTTSSSGKAQNPQATSSGAETETLDEAESRLPSNLQHKNRAVSLKDFDKLSSKSPGVTVNRAQAIPSSNDSSSKKKKHSAFATKKSSSGENSSNKEPNDTHQYEIYETLGTPRHITLPKAKAARQKESSD